MRLSTSKRPSPALIVSAIALTFALVGTSVAADPVAKLNAKKVKKIAKREISKAEPTLNVRSAKTAESATSATNAVNAVNAGNSNTVGGARIVLINHRSNGVATDAAIGTLNGLTLRVTCTALGVETLTAVTSVTGGEIAQISDDAQAADASAAGISHAFDDSFNTGDVFTADNGGNSSDRIYQINYSGADNKNANIFVATEDAISGNNCVVSGYMIG